MKKALLYLLLFSYTTIICKPVLPSVSDCVAHIFWYSEHMATVHYEHGKYHVHYENIKESKKGNQDKDSNIPKNETAVSEHMIADEGHNFAIPILRQNYFSPISSTLLHRCVNSDFRPPRA